MLDTPLLAPPHLAIPASHPFPSKAAPQGPVYMRQLEVIQLVEVEAPPPRQIPSDFASSAASSSSSSSSSSSHAASADSEDWVEDSESESSESVGSSYCSSDEEEMKERKIMFYDDTYSIRLNRVLAWRESFAKAMGITDSPAAPSYAPLAALHKRKVDYDEEPFDDSSSSSHSSKRSRSSSPEPELLSSGPSGAWSHRRLSAHSCPACDESFTTRQHLQQHGQDPRLGDACRVAVEYGLESS